MAAAAYSPGKPTPARLVNEHEQLYAVDSFREEGKSYLVNLKRDPTCTCPHFSKRGPLVCKHIQACMEQRDWLKAAKLARSLSDEQLEKWLRHHQEEGNLLVAGAIRVERARRKQAAAEDAKLKAIFA